jgi:TolB-like protein/Tfp pilus assembly protein PilF
VSHVQISPESVRAQVGKILASAAFCRSERLARFLNFAVEQVLEGRADHLKEFVIGVEVFDKTEKYDPRMDPIVRVEARRLREKLRRYYETEGREDSLAIDFPTGTYAPVVKHRDASDQLSQGARRDENAIAILPFANLSSEPDNEYFSDGLTEELINALTKVDGLRVVAWSSSFQFKGKARDIRRIAEQLGVRAILEGSVRRTCERMRITAQLVDANDGHYIWSETYERDAADVFAVQDEISSAIVYALRTKLARTVGKPLVKRYTENLQAYHLYLKGRFQWNKRTEESFYKSLGYYEQAIRIDPNYAPAYSGMADAYIMLAKHGVVRAHDIMPKAKAAAVRALDIDPALSEAHVSMGSILATYEWNWLTAEHHYKRALELNASYPTAHHWFGYDYLAARGRLDEALAELSHAYHLDPLSLIITTCRGTVYDLMRDHERALAHYQRVLELDPVFVRALLSAARAYLQLDMYEESIAAFEKARELSAGSPVPVALLAHAYNLAGRHSDGARLRAQLEQCSKGYYISPYLLARAYLGFDDNRVIELLEKAAEERDPRMAHLKVSPIFDCVRDQARFCALVERMGV